MLPLHEDRAPRSPPPRRGAARPWRAKSLLRTDARRGRREPRHAARIEVLARDVRPDPLTSRGQRRWIRARLSVSDHFCRGTDGNGHGSDSVLRRLQSALDERIHSPLTSVRVHWILFTSGKTQSEANSSKFWRSTGASSHGAHVRATPRDCSSARPPGRAGSPRGASSSAPPAAALPGSPPSPPARSGACP